MEHLSDNINELIMIFEEKLSKTSNFVKSEFQTIRAGRVNPSIVERVNVDYYGEPTSLVKLGNISCSDSRTIVISIYDQAVLRDVCKALTAANLGANPIDDGRVIRMIFPLLTTDRRKELVKQVRKIAEEGKVAMRNDRRDALAKVKKVVAEEKISEDETSFIEKDIQKHLDTAIEGIDRLLANKETEIMEI